ncbi:TolC family protein [Algivirga pacifica]|uniref:TolC family protein n=2 Tax=Algivirga pacifica TaxID=1162670 RepID=A0ABP9DDH0_9BACT
MAHIGVAQSTQNSVPTLSMSEAISKSLKNNYDILIEQKRQEDAEQLNSWGQAGRYPTVAFQGGGQSNYIDNKPANPFALAGNNISNSINAALNAEWTLFNGFRVNISKEQLEKMEAQSNQQAQMVIESAVEQTILAYYNVQLQEENLKVFKTVLDLSKDRVELVRLQRELGSGTTFDVSQEETTFYNDSSNFVNQELVVANAYRDLNLLMGEKQLNQTYQLTDKLSYKPQDYAYEDLLERMQSQNSNLQRQYTTLALRQLEIRAQKTLRSPDVRLNAGYSGTQNWFTADFPIRTESEVQIPAGVGPTDPVTWADFVNLFGGSDVEEGETLTERQTNAGYSYGPFAQLNINIPIYTGGRNRRAIQSARLAYEQEQVNTTKVLQTLMNELNKTYEQYLNRRELVELTEKSVAAADINLRLSKEQLEQGTINSFDYRQVQTRYLNAAFRHLSAQYDLIQSNAALLRLTGGIVD